MKPIISHPGDRLSGTFNAPGDKSISHRALILGALAVGETRIDGLLEAGDVLRTADALRCLGARCRRQPDGAWLIDGVGVGGARQPDKVLDMGNSGTGARLLMGVLASQAITARMTGDRSLRARPMDRVIAPLRKIGARFSARPGGLMPVTVIGSDQAMPIEYRPPVASAQVKSAILLAALNAPGETTVIEPAPTRDHTERLLAHFGAEVEINAGSDGETVIRLRGQTELSGRQIEVPGDPSSAAFPLVAALITPGSQVTVRNVGINPLRAGLFQTLTEMGADLTVDKSGQPGFEPVADITARAGPLRGVDVPASRAPSMIDEYPILAVAAAQARGTTVLRGLGELKVKESNRLDAMAAGLTACGADVEINGDDLIIHGSGAPTKGGAVIAARHDHRIAMAFLTLGLASKRAVTIDDGAMIDTSFPGFVELINRLGGDLRAGDTENRRSGT